MSREFLVLRRRFKSESSCRIYRETIASLTRAMMLLLPRETPVSLFYFLFFNFLECFFRLYERQAR